MELHEHDIEQLEEVLEPVEDPDLLNTNLVSASSDTPPIMRPFVNSIFPVLLINKEFLILFANRACNNLFTGYFRLQNNLFFDVFGKSLGSEALKEIRQAVLFGNHGYSWKGSIKTKTREAGTLQTKVYLFPVIQANQAPDNFIVLFDDVTQENKKLLQSVFISLLEASKLKDNDTGKHIVRVNFYSERLARELYNRPGYEEVDRDFIEDIGFLASMHDVGKIGTPDDILNKEGPLSDWEWTIMKEHTKNGAFILSTYPNPMAREIALNHHERWDGTGYPFQLEGPMIPLSARIVTIADVYDALRMKRSYKEAYDHETSIEKMLAWKGKNFDPQLFDVFMTIQSDFEKIYADNADEEPN
ncbi:HD domain-containing phosphohydrolase [Gracilinema caldarium]|jgi:putative two-component system response regulator|uniref:HD domain-containing phosphohydrolase n=1 Tax=Gracilinema caldarium TaxID=215591 RepID=UPI0026F0BC7D|nr:HD domain-containing phosphohydrolase [Gracilinema caldarium]